MADNFNNQKVNKTSGFESKVIIGEKIDIKHPKAIREVQEMIGLQKSPAEIAEGLINYLIIQDHQKVARIIIEKARIYLSKLNSNNNIVNIDQQLQQVEVEFGDLIKYFCQEDKGKLTSKLKSLKIIIEGLESVPIKHFLQHILEIIDNYNKSRSKKSFDKKQGFENFKANITSAFSVLKNLL